MNTSSVETHGIVLHVNNNNVTYLDSFEVEHIPKAIKIHRQQKYRNKYLQNTILRFIMCGYFCIGFIDFKFKGKCLSDFTLIFTKHFLRYDKDPQLKNAVQFRLDKIKDNFIIDNRGKKTMIKRLGKYTAVFDDADKIIIVLLVIGGIFSIDSLATVIGALVGKTSASLV